MSHWTATEATDTFRRWYVREGHWAYPTIERAFHVWVTVGLVDLPDPPRGVVLTDPIATTL